MTAPHKFSDADIEQAKRRASLVSLVGKESGHMTNNDPLACEHERTHLTFRLNSGGHRFVQRQCLACGAPVGSAVSKADAAKTAPLGSIPPFDIELEQRFMKAALDQKERERAERADWYHNEYLKSKEWRERARLVHARAGGVCEGCRQAKSTQVHHLTYRNVGNEFLWDLVAICDACHERVHAEAQ